MIRRNYHECDGQKRSGTEIAMSNGNKWLLHFDTYEREDMPYISMSVDIEHCPFCGKHLGNEMEVCDD